ncbi:MAG: hypothetical protein LBG28_16465 [Tannerella sp.]|nr:hypothetical protein [Tannerella sp.]
MARYLQRERERERDLPKLYLYNIRACAKGNKNNLFKPCFPVVVFMEKSDDAGFFYSPQRRPPHVAGRDFHARSNCLASLRGEHALCPLPSYEGRNRRNGERFLFNRNRLNRKIRFTRPNEKNQPHDRKNKYSEYQQAVRIFESLRFGQPQSITFKNEMPMEAGMNK